MPSDCRTTWRLDVEMLRVITSKAPFWNAQLSINGENTNVWIIL